MIEVELNTIVSIITQRNQNFMNYIPIITFATAIGVSPVFSQNLYGENYREKVKKSVFATEIVICSEIDGVNEVSVSSFYEKHFAGWEAPIIQNGNEMKHQDVEGRLLFIVSDGTIGDYLRNCLRRQDVKEGELQAYIKQQSERLKISLGALEGVKLPSYYNSASASWGYKDIGKLHVISFTSHEEEPYRTNHAITHMFGLDISVCEHTDACVKK